MTYSSMSHSSLSDFVLYTGQLLHIVDVVLGEPYCPSKELTPLPSFIVPTPLPLSPKRTYYHSGFKKTLESLHEYLQQRLTDNYYHSDQERRGEEQDVIRLFQPVVESIEHSLHEFQVPTVFRSLYEELQEYNTCYAKQYQKGMNQMVYLLMTIKENNAKMYYQVIAHYDFAEYYRTFHEIEDFALLPALANLLEKPDVTSLELYQAYMACLEHLRERPTYLADQQKYIAELQTLL
jgi:hypothetical protein